jgi:anti-anti-sigma factor
MPSHLKIFRTETVEDHLVLIPQSEGASFRYADLQMEGNYVRTMAADKKYRGLIIDLSNMNYFGSEFIGALITIAREKKNRGGKAVVCGAAPQMLEVLQNMSLFKIWPYYPTREDAVAALNTPST